MLKKKNIAIMTAAAAVATSVAPVFAAVETQYLNEDSFIAEVERLLAVEYSNSKESGHEGIMAGNDYLSYDTTNGVYDIRYSINDDGNTTHGVVYTVEEAKALVERAKVKNATLELTVIDKGHVELNGKIEAVETNDYVKYGASISAVTAASTNTVVSSITTGTTVDGTTTATIKLANDQEIVVRADDYKLDLTQAIDKNGNLVSVENANVAKQAVGFKKVQTGLNIKNDIPAKEVAKLQFREGAATLLTLDMSELKDENGYTQKGADLINMLARANNDDIAANKTTVVKDGVKYDVEYNYVSSASTTDDLTDIVATDDNKYSFDILLSVNKSARSLTRSLPLNRNVKITITGDIQKEVEAFRTAATTTDTVEVGSKPLYSKLAGDSRFETAIEISKASYDAKNTTGTTAGAVVLVGESAVVDGLAAAPLAKQKNAPILFAKKDVVTEETMNEIKRVVNKNATIYLVGGEAVISKEVEKQLIKEMNANIVRLAGEGRAETSIEIAEEMMKAATTLGTTFVVGADGEADAMSIASYASQKTTGGTISPIIVTPAAGLTKDAKYFLDLNDATTASVVGGEAKVSTQVMKDLKALSISADRISGNDRHETNANVISTFYNTAAATTSDTVYVAKDGYVGGNDKLIDALAVAPLAGKNEAPIVLATDSVTEKQKIAAAAAADITDNKKLVQVGGGITSSLMKTLATLFGLDK